MGDAFFIFGLVRLMDRAGYSAVATALNPL